MKNQNQSCFSGGEKTNVLETNKRSMKQLHDTAMNEHNFWNYIWMRLHNILDCN